MHPSRKKKIQKYFELLIKMQRTIGTQKDHFLKQHGLNRPQAEILYLIAEEKKLSIKNIASEMGITSSAATQIIERLVQSGFLERTEGENDRRIIIVQFSPSGRTKFEIFKKAHIERIGTLLEMLNDKELDLLITIPQKVLKKN